MDLVDRGIIRVLDAMFVIKEDDALSGLELDRDGVDTLLSRTEGRPAGLSLAASHSRVARASGGREIGLRDA